MAKIRNLLNRLKTINLPWSSTRFVGHDLQGNMYFEGPPTREGITLPRRSVQYQDGRSLLSQYDPNAIPVQWQAWLRHTRPSAPTPDELRADIARRAQVQERAIEIAAKEAAVASHQHEKDAIHSGASPAALAAASAADAVPDAASQPGQQPLTESERTIATAAAAAASAAAGQKYTPESWTPNSRPARQ